MRLPSSVLMLSVAGLIASLGATAVAGAPAESGPAQGPQVDPRAVGVVIGGILGQRISRAMDPEDRRIAAEAEYHALEFGQTGTQTPWENPVSQHRGVIVPGKPYPQGDEYCRGYMHTVDLGGAGETIKGIACRTPDGAWRAGI